MRRGWIAGGLLLAIAAFALWQWAIQWTPDRQQYPLQGPLIGAAEGPVEWRTLAAMDSNFAYLRATSGADQRDARFAVNLEAARDAKLPVGAVHRFSLCRSASLQAANFVTTVPRDAALLPPVIELLEDDGACAASNGRPPAVAPVQSELMTFINQIEAHSAKPVVLKLSPGFEARYQVAELIGRNLWLEGDYRAPDYGSRPFVMWSANPRLHLDGVAQAVEWVVVKP